MSPPRLLFLFLLLVVVSSSGVEGQSIRLREPFPKLRFSSPIDFQHAGDGSNRLYVVEQRGVIRGFENSASVDSAPVFLNISGRVNFSGELGLLGLAFDPAYADNGYFYVNYTASNPLRTIIARFSRSQGNPLVADSTSELILLTYDQPYVNHNGGQLAFGPDGYLYIAAGDGGSGGDPRGNGQSRNTLLGKILRIDVKPSPLGGNYSIPPDNPFVNNTAGYRQEIYSYGMRNPWRFSFDPATGWLWAGDVGQGAWEEVDIVQNGKNYGWNKMEGFHCYPEGTTGCDTTGLTLPIWEYGHSLGVSITGGYVYRGSRIPELVGEYIYGDYGSGRIWGLRYDGTAPAVNRLLLASGLNITSFGVDADGELYLCAFNGMVYTFDIQQGGEVPSRGRSAVTLGGNDPNPFSTTTRIRYRLEHPTDVELVVRDLLGRVIAHTIARDQEAGEGFIEFDGSAQPPGIYYYTIISGEGRSEQGRMVLVK